MRALSLRRCGRAALVIRTILLAGAALVDAAPASAQILWPEGQLLPSFPAPAQNQDLFFLRGPENSAEELPLFASLKAVVNKKQPRIFSYEGDAFAEGPYTWLESFGLSWTEYDDDYSLLEKYKSEVKGLVVFDPAVPHTLNLATTVAGGLGALVVDPSLLPTLTGAPYNFQVLEDYRGDFASRLEVYSFLYDTIWPTIDHRILVGLSPSAHRASLREYAGALGAAVIWLDPMVEEESALLNKFLSSLKPGATYMGWWPEEGAGVERGSNYGIATVASDYATNLTLHSGMPREIAVKPISPKPVLQNKIYVAFILSDGDNLQYVEHLMRKLWNNPDRGAVPIGWTVSPAMLDAMPGALNYYHSTATENDNLISGPSGWGYGYPNFWKDEGSLERFAKVTDDYAQRAGLRVVTVWNTITGGIDADVGNTFAQHAPAVLGLTAQNTGGGLTIYDSKLPGFALSCNYCTGEEAMQSHIASASEGWDGSAPRFILIQAQPWTDVRPTSFKNVAESLNEDYVVVRPDNWFQLLRQENGLPIEPVKRIAAGTHRLMNEASQKCLALGIATNADPLVPVIQTECADDDAQRWSFTETTSGYVKISPLVDATKVIDISGGTGAIESGRPTIIWDDLGNTNQQWQPVWEAGSDEYHLIVRHSDQCLDVPNGTSEDVGLRQWTCNGSAAQMFHIMDPVWPPLSDDPPELGAGGTGGMSAASTGGMPSTGLPEDPPAGMGGALSSDPNSSGDAGSTPGCSCSVGRGIPRRRSSGYPAGLWIGSAFFVGCWLVRRRPDLLRSGRLRR